MFVWMNDKAVGIENVVKYTLVSFSSQCRLEINTGKEKGAGCGSESAMDRLRS